MTKYVNKKKCMHTSYKFELNNKGNREVGFLVPLENELNIPFYVKRIFYTYAVPYDSNRGAHAYFNTKQVLICLSGNLKIRCFDGQQESVYNLDKCNEALYIDAKVWRTTFEHSSDAVLLVLSSLEYDESDYIRDYDEFMEVVRCT